MNLAEITPLILTYNEEPNLGSCLERLSWARRIVVMDSGSTDETLAICARHPDVEVVHRAFDNHTNQWNHGLDQVRTPWVLTLDADYLIPPEFVEEIRALPGDCVERGWFANFRYIAFGKGLRGTLYPRRLLLFDPKVCRYEQDGHTQLLRADCATGVLQTRIDHDDRKPLSRWLDSQRKYAALEAEKLSAGSEARGVADKLRAMIWPASPAAFLYTLVGKRLILDGWPGVFYALQRTYAELLLSLELLELRLASRDSNGNSSR